MLSMANAGLKRARKTFQWFTEGAGRGGDPGRGAKDARDGFLRRKQSSDLRDDAQVLKRAKDFSDIAKPRSRRGTRKTSSRAK